jgi:hypothetical protein
MNTMLALAGAGGFLLSVSLICLIAYRYAEPLEVWMRKRAHRRH